MKFNITRQRALPALITLFFTCLLGMYALIMGEPVALSLPASESILGGYISGFQADYPLWAAVISTLFIFIATVKIGRFVSQNNLYSTATNIQIPLLGVFYWATCYGDDFLLSTLVAMLCTQALMGFMLSVRNESHLAPIFNASILLSFLPMFYTSAVAFWVVLPVILILISATLREWIIAFCGLLLPFAMLSYIYWLCGFEILFVGESMLSMLLSPAHLFSLTTIMPFHLAISALGLLLSLLSLLWIGSDVHKRRVRLQITVAIFFASLLSLISPSATLLTLPLMAPMSAILASLSVSMLSARAANIIYTLLFILLLLSLFMPLYLELPV
ncbi:MAG: hypothetical protein SNG38_00025 [Rikenellaceae bacterium]